MPGPPRAEPAGGANRGRIVLGVVAMALVVLALSLRAIATFWTDFLWFDSLDLTSVWTRLISAKVTLGAATGLVFFALLWVNLVIADRLAPRFRSVVGPDDEVLVMASDGLWDVMNNQEAVDMALHSLQVCVDRLDATGLGTRGR
jgi:uncharacterized membrane protein (UPF0182 family)